MAFTKNFYLQRLFWKILISPKNLCLLPLDLQSQTTIKE